jgi:EAL domain-containing protein (putative c-di-GMP-specific phosphodiesterase class I)
VLVSAVLDLSTALGKSVVAEGIERDEELDWLASMGCSHGQGYLLGRPTAGADLRARMTAPEPDLMAR